MIFSNPVKKFIKDLKGISISSSEVEYYRQRVLDYKKEARQPFPINNVEQFVAGRVNGYNTQIKNLIRHLLDLQDGVYMSFKIIVPEKDPFTEQRWKSANNKTYTLKDVPFDIPSFGNSFVFEAII